MTRSRDQEKISVDTVNCLIGSVMTDDVEQRYCADLAVRERKQIVPAYVLIDLSKWLEPRTMQLSLLLTT